MTQEDSTSNMASSNDTEPLKPLVIFGAGGHGRVCAEVAQAMGYEVTGFIDGAMSKGERVNDIEVLGSSLGEIRTSHSPDNTNVFIAIGDNNKRAALFNGASALGYTVPTLCHPSAIVSPSAQIGAGTVIIAGAIINANAMLGRYCIVNTAATLDHDNQLADGVQICPGVHSAGTVTFGERAFVGTGASVIPGITIGEGAAVAAGAVVLRDVEAHTTVAGVPARSIPTPD